MFNQLLKKNGRPSKLRSKLIILTVLLVVVFGSMAWRTSQCTVDMDTVPFQIVRSEEEPVTTYSKANIESTVLGFSSFTTAVTEHLVSKLNQENICLNSAKSKKHSLLQFAPRPVNSVRRPLPSVPPLGERSSGVCRITSPWVELVIERKPVPLVQGIFIYSERQLLADQAVLSGARDVPPGAAMPLSYEEFRRYADFEYARSEIHHQPAEKPIEERVPPDLLWLFQHASLDADYDLSGSAGSSMKIAMAMGSKSYTKIVTILIDRCFESNGEDIHYDDILDIDDPVLFEQYKIDTIISIPK